MSEKRLGGWRGLVTGASSGIGADLARRLAAEGANLVITARRRDRLEGLAHELRKAYGVDVEIIAKDLAHPEAPAALFAETEGKGISIDLLVNNAGFGVYRPFIEVPWEQHRDMIQVNLVTLTELTQRFVLPMVKRGRGYIMNIASIASYTPTPNFAVYGPTKAYVRNFTETVDYELRGTGVRAICINPGGTESEFSQRASQKLTKTGRRVLMTSAQCAAIAVNKMLSGRRNVVTGFSNALAMWLTRFLPRPWIIRASGWMMKQAAEMEHSPALPPAEVKGALESEGSSAQKDTE